MLYGIPQLTAKGDHLSVTVDVTDDWGDAAGDITGKPLSFVVTDDGYSRQVNDTIGQGDSVSLPTADSGVGLWSILSFALLGV